MVACPRMTSGKGNTAAAICWLAVGTCLDCAIADVKNRVELNQPHIDFASNPSSFRSYLNEAQSIASRKPPWISYKPVSGP